MALKLSLCGRGTRAEGENAAHVGKTAHLPWRARADDELRIQLGADGTAEISADDLIQARLGALEQLPAHVDLTRNRLDGCRVARGRGVGFLNSGVLAGLRSDRGAAAQTRNRVENRLPARGIDHARQQRTLVESGRETAHLAGCLAVEVREEAGSRGTQEVVARGLAEVALLALLVVCQAPACGCERVPSGNPPGVAQSMPR
jgi:hypothetical protein